VTTGKQKSGQDADAADMGMSLTCPRSVNNVDLGTSSNDY
jgi:hypothetical protein